MTQYANLTGQLFCTLVPKFHILYNYRAGPALIIEKQALKTTFSYGIIKTHYALRYNALTTYGL